MICVEIWCSHCGGALIQARVAEDEVKEKFEPLRELVEIIHRAHECPGKLEATQHRIV